MSILARLVPGPLVRWFARPYVAGGTMEEGLQEALAQHARLGALATLDLLGEGDLDEATVERNVAAYTRLVDALGSDPRFADPAVRPSVSLKPSAFTAGDRAATRGRIGELAERARKRGVKLTIDMEDRTWTDDTLTWAVELFERGLDVGTVLQTRLHRTEADLARIPAGMRLRLVIGIYPEPAEVALTSKPPMKERMLDYAGRLLGRGVFVEFGTHDERILVRFLRDVAPAAPAACELQLLLGVPRRRFLCRMQAGAFGTVLPVRFYVPFALGWNDATAYLRRRLAESPAMMWSVLRNWISLRRR